MSTLVEIQDAVGKLPADEKKALALWLGSQTALEMRPEEERALLASLDDAMRDLDSGKGVSVADVRKRVSSWAGR